MLASRAASSCSSVGSPPRLATRLALSASSRAAAISVALGGRPSSPFSRSFISASLAATMSAAQGCADAGLPDAKDVQTPGCRMQKDAQTPGCRMQKDVWASDRQRSECGGSPNLAALIWQP
eukprot:296409-Prymnesium_polylepis.1